MAKTNPLDHLVQATTTNDFRVPKRPRLADSIAQHGLMEGVRQHQDADEEWAQLLEKSVNERLQPKGAVDSLGSVATQAAGTVPGSAVSSQTVVTVTSGGFPGYSYALHQWLDSLWQGALKDFVLSLIPSVAPPVIDPVTPLLVQFYCVDTGKWHAVRLLGDPSTWDIDPVGEEFPDPACDHAFVSYQYPCPDTGNWHAVSLVGDPPTWSIDETGVPVPASNIDLAFGTKAVYNPDLKLWITVGLAGVPPTWAYA